MEDKVGKFGIAFLILFLLGVVWNNKWKVDELKEENAKLKAQVVEYQLKSYPAITARGWWSVHGAVRNAADITPDVLEYALNPCYLTPSGNWDNSSPACGPAGRGQTVLIKIEATK